MKRAQDLRSRGVTHRKKTKNHDRKGPGVTEPQARNEQRQTQMSQPKFTHTACMMGLHHTSRLYTWSTEWINGKNHGTNGIILACRLLQMVFKFAIMHSLRFDLTASAFQAEWGGLLLRQLFNCFWKRQAQISHLFGWCSLWLYSSQT